MLTAQQELDLYANIITEDEYAPIAQKMLELNKQIKQENEYKKIAVPTTDILLELLIEMQQQNKEIIANK